MPSEILYDRGAALKYAKEWAFNRNPVYLNFDGLGGDCTNFASQCIFAGAGIMNYTPLYGWYYKNSYDRTPSWTGVQYLYDFLMNNRGSGPYGTIIKRTELMIGDIVQLGDIEGRFYHSPVVVGNYHGEILVAAHTYDVYNYPLSSYNFERIRCIRINARK